MLLLGHRGCRGEFTENTFAAFDHALAAGCDGFEFDVRLTRDRIPIIWHDARLRGRSISRHTFISLREHCINSHKSSALHAYRSIALRRKRRPSVELCDLEAVLARYGQVAWMDIEVKVAGLEAQLAELLRRSPPARGFVLSSFHRRVLLEFRRIDPELPLGFIFDRMPLERTWRKLAVEYVMPKADLVTADRVRRFHDAGKKVLTWTVNQLSAIRRLQAAGVDGVIGDDPVLLASTR